MPPSEAPLDLLAVGETLVDFISVEQTDWLRNATTFALSREPCRSAVRRVFCLAHEAGKVVSLDPNYSARIWSYQKEMRHVLQEMYQCVNVTKPSLGDAGRIFGREYGPEQYTEMFHDLGAEVVIITMGKEGVLISEDGHLIGHVPARPVEVRDATGAGDAFWAGFPVALLDGNSLERCAVFAREVVELKPGRVGPLPMEIDRQQLYAYMKKAHTSHEQDSELEKET